MSRNERLRSAIYPIVIFRQNYISLLDALLWHLTMARGNTALLKLLDSHTPNLEMLSHLKIPLAILMKMSSPPIVKS